MKTKLKDLFAYENVIFEKTPKAKICCWNNKTLLMAEANSVEVVQQAYSFDEIIQGVVSLQEDVIILLLFSALSVADSSLTLEEFIEFIDFNDFAEYQAVVLDGMLNYMPNEELQTQLKEMNSGDRVNEALEDDSDFWAFNYFFCKKNLAMSDEEFWNSTWRLIAIMQREFLKTTSEYQKNKTVGAEFIDI